MAFSDDILAIQGEDLKTGKIKIEILPQVEDCMYAMATSMLDVIRENNDQGNPTLMIVPVGPVMQYPYFVRGVNEQKISLRQVTFINMDEYMANQNEMISVNNPLSFRKHMDENCYQLIDPSLRMPASQQIFPTPDNAALIDDVIAKHNGVDVCYGGIGINGHIAFNEPPQAGEQISEQAFINLSVRVQKISRETQVVNGISDLHGAYDLMPEYCVTIGFKQILAAKKIRLYCFRPWHYAVIRKASFGKKTVDFPVSLLQDHPNTLITIPQVLA